MQHARSSLAACCRVCGVRVCHPPHHCAGGVTYTQVKAAQADVKALLLVQPGNAAGKELREELEKLVVDVV